MRSDYSDVEFITTGRLRILEDLGERNGTTLPELPHRWPFTRNMLEDMVNELELVGLVESGRSGRVPGQVAYILSESGRALLASAAAGPALVAV